MSPRSSIGVWCEERGPLALFHARPSRASGALARLLARRGSRAMTLIEVLIVMALIALIPQRGRARLRADGIVAPEAFVDDARRCGARGVFACITSSSKTVRLVMDFTDNAIWLEEGDQPHLVQSKDASGPAARARPPAPRSRRSRTRAAFSRGPRLRGPRSPRSTRWGSWRRIRVRATRRSSVVFDFDACRLHTTSRRGKNGRAYLYFWPGGQTERAAIQLKVGPSDDETDTITLLVATAHGEGAIKDGVAELPKPLDDKEASDAKIRGHSNAFSSLPRVFAPRGHGRDRDPRPLAHRSSCRRRAASPHRIEARRTWAKPWSSGAAR